MSQLTLHNKTVVLACSAHTSTPLIAGLEKLGARVIFFPTIEIREVSDKRRMDRALDALEEYSWIIFTSSYGVLYLQRRMTERHIPVERWHNLNVCAIGPSTAAQLEQAGIPVSLIPEDFSAEGVVRAFDKRVRGLQNLKGSKILLARALRGREEIPRMLSAAGARVDVVPCYENVLPEMDKSLVRSIMDQSVDLLVFTSSSTAANAAMLLGKKHWKRLLTRTTLAALGPVTAKTLASLGKEAEVVPSQNTAASLLDAIERHFAQLK
jgi:uroporphyrinogen III methyltransferase/synthase